ncbi:MAG: ribosome maturation factor RimP [Myxococcota bacterium]
MYRDIPPDLLRVVEPVVCAHGLELVDASVKQGRAGPRVLIVLDTASGDGRVLVDQCAVVSREVGHGLDAADLVRGSYTLEVTSPGVDRTLGREVDFERVVGREVRVETREPLGGRKRFKGELLAFERGEARVRTETGDFGIPFTEIVRAQAFYPQESKRKARG